MSDWAYIKTEVEDKVYWLPTKDKHKILAAHDVVFSDTVDPFTAICERYPAPAGTSFVRPFTGYLNNEFCYDRDFGSKKRSFVISDDLAVVSTDPKDMIDAATNFGCVPLVEDYFESWKDRAISYYEEAQQEKGRDYRVIAISDDIVVSTTHHDYKNYTWAVVKVPKQYVQKLIRSRRPIRKKLPQRDFPYGSLLAFNRWASELFYKKLIPTALSTNNEEYVFLDDLKRYYKVGVELVFCTPPAFGVQGRGQRLISTNYHEDTVQHFLGMVKLLKRMFGTRKHRKYPEYKGLLNALEDWIKGSFTHRQKKFLYIYGSLKAFVKRELRVKAARKRLKRMREAHKSNTP